MIAPLSSEAPYTLGFGRIKDSDTPWIGARGPADILVMLAKLDGALLSDGAVVFPGTRINVMAAEAVATPVSVADEYRTWRANCMEVPMAWQADADQALHNDGYKPRPLLPHQLHFLAQLGRYHRSAINASEQGTGKTTTGWLATQLWQGQRVLIVCPKSLVREWEKEWKVVWEGDRPIQCVPLDTGSATKRQDIICDLARTPGAPATALVINYEMVASVSEALHTWHPDIVICDESWRIKNPVAQCTKAVMRLCDKAKHVLLLTGTPIGNHIGDLWSQIRVMGKDLMPENYHQFLNRYAVMEPMQLGPRTIWKPVDILDPIGVMKRIEPVWYRATKAACLDLPPKRYEEVRLTMPPSVARLYKEVQEDGESALGKDLSLASAATVALRLHQIAGGHRPTYQDDTGTFALHPAGCPKIEWLRVWAEDTLAGNQTARAIVWATYTHELERITQLLGKILGKERVVMCWGGTDNDQLEHWKESYLSRSEAGVQVLVCQLKKMAFGHNLQCTDVNVYFSNNWSYVVRSQSEDRSHRKGRSDSVRYVDLVLDGTIDLDIREALARKTDFAVRLSPETAVRK